MCPRIYAPNEAHNMDFGHVDFKEGVAVVPVGTDTTFFSTAKGYVVDTSKHEATLFDLMTVAQLRELCDYLQVVYLPATTKPELVRLVEDFVSDHMLGALTVVSAAGTAVGDSKITVAEQGTFKYKTGAAALTPYYMDEVSAWTDIASGDDITPPAGAVQITVASVDATGHVLALGDAAIVVK